MKKVFLLVIMSFLSLGCLVACQETKISAPSNFKINEGVASWDKVEGATKYRLDFVGESTIKRVVTETSVDLNSLDLPFGTYTVNVQAIGKDGESDYTTLNLQFISEDLSEKVTNLSGASMMDGKFVKWMGRNFYDEEKNYNIMYHSASGFEVKFRGTTVECELEATNSINSSKMPYVVVMIDDNYDTRVRVALNQKNVTLKLADLNEDDGEVHTVTLLKSTESTDSHVYVKSISTNGSFVEGVEFKERKIEVIAASSSTGYGNLATSPEETKTSTNSDCVQGFAYLTARDLNAEINIYSASGWGAKASIYAPQGKNVYDAYKKYDFFSDVDWNYGLYIPDVVIINLGTNDWSYINQADSEAEKANRKQAFFDQYVDFLDFLHKIYPDAKILMMYGLMNESNVYEITEDIYEEALKTNPTLGLIKCSGDARGSSSHPSKESHRANADLIIAKVKEMTGWK